MKDIMRKIVFLFFLIFLTNNLSADKYTKWNIISRLGFNYNMHNSEQVILPEKCYECFNIEKGTGTGLNISLGFGYVPETDFMGITYLPFFEVGYNNLSGTLNEDNFVGNIIGADNSVKQGIINFELDNSISVLQFSPYIYFYPFKSVPTAFRIGLAASFITQKSFTLNESIKTPGVTYSDGTTSQSEIAGDIPKTSGMILSIPIGVKYDLFHTDGFTISPEINYNLALNDFHSDSKWKINQFTAGVSVVYNIPKANEPEPIYAPIPKLPEPPIETEISSQTVLYVNDKLANKNTNAELHYSLNENRIEMPVLPYIFFDKDSYAVTKHTNPDLDMISLSNYINSTSENNNEINKIKIIAVATEDEVANIAEKRMATAIELLKASNIKIENIEKETKVIPTKKLRYPEIAEENRCVYFEMANNNSFVISKTIERDVKFSSLNTKIKIIPNSQAGIDSIKGDVYLDDNFIGSINRDENIFNIDNKYFDVNELSKIYKLSVKYIITDKNGNKKEFYETANIKQVLDNKTENINKKMLLNDNQSNLYFIAYNTFDSSNPYMINPAAKEIIENAISNGKQVEIYGLTDNLGTQEYNLNLSVKRVQSILKKLSIDSELITIKSTEKYFFENTTAFGRLLNRSVIMFVK